MWCYETSFIYGLKPIKWKIIIKLDIVPCLVCPTPTISIFDITELLRLLGLKKQRHIVTYQLGHQGTLGCFHKSSINGMTQFFLPQSGFCSVEIPSPTASRHSSSVWPAFRDQKNPFVSLQKIPMSNHQTLFKGFYFLWVTVC